MTWRRALLGLAAGGALLGAILAAGGYNVSAAAGHLPPVAALLHFTMQNSVNVRAGGSPPDDLGTDARALAGAVHYDLVCRDCHGAPGLPLGAVARSLEPPPPHILDAVGHWQPEELFWIVKNGIKMTGMPAWPAQQRDDEVWSVVAFLLRLPDMDAHAYRQAVSGPAADTDPSPGDPAFASVLERCARCHGYGGDGMNATALPRLDGQNRQYLRAALEAYASGRRASGIMQTQASATRARYFDALARHYADAGEAQPGRRRPAQPGPAPGRPLQEDAAGRASARPSGLLARGQRLAEEGDPERLIPACSACHGPSPYPRSDAYPVLAGQSAEYLETQLRLFRDGHRGGAEFAEIMHLVAKPLRNGEIAALARYYASLE